MSEQGDMMTFGGHLGVLRRMLFRVIGVTAVLGVVIFCFKDTAFRLLLAPADSDFVTWRFLERAGRVLGMDFGLAPFKVQLISTELSSQFMTHVSVSVWLSLLFASPYVLFEVFRFVAPALYERERRRSVRFVVAGYVLFLAGVVMGYFVVFPVSFRFLGTYQVAPGVVNQINISSYVSSFLRLTLAMGLAFLLPLAAVFLARAGLLSAAFLRRYRRHAVLLICIVAAVVTPPDALSLVLVAVPLCLLYEAGIFMASWAERRG